MLARIRAALAPSVLVGTSAEHLARAAACSCAARQRRVCRARGRRGRDADAGAGRRERASEHEQSLVCRLPRRSVGGAPRAAAAHKARHAGGWAACGGAALARRRVHRAAPRCTARSAACRSLEKATHAALLRSPPTQVPPARARRAVGRSGRRRGRLRADRGRLQLRGGALAAAASSAVASRLASPAPVLTRPLPRRRCSLCAAMKWAPTSWPRW